MSGKIVSRVDNLFFFFRSIRSLSLPRPGEGASFFAADETVLSLIAACQLYHYVGHRIYHRLIAVDKLLMWRSISSRPRSGPFDSASFERPTETLRSYDPSG